MPPFQRKTLVLLGAKNVGRRTLKQRLTKADPSRFTSVVPCTSTRPVLITDTRMWANAQRDGRPAKHRWRPPFNAAKFG